MNEKPARPVEVGRTAALYGALLLAGYLWLGWKVIGAVAIIAMWFVGMIALVPLLAWLTRDW